MQIDNVRNDPSVYFETNWELLRKLILLSLPVGAEHLLHIIVGMTDTYLANHLEATKNVTGAALDHAHLVNSTAGAAVGSVTYILWFVGLIVTSIGTGSSAIISRAIGSKHRRLANKVCGQSMMVASIAGVVFGIALMLFAHPISRGMGLHVDTVSGVTSAADYFMGYLHILAWGVPLAVLMFTANSCLRGAGDTLTPALAMIVVDVVNLILSVSLTFGHLGLPKMGFNGIAVGTMCAYLTGGMMQIIVLWVGRGGIRLFLHRLRPEWLTIKRILRIGIPAGSEGLLMYFANIVVLSVVNHTGNIAAAAHNLAIRIEAFSFMSGFAIATAVSTTVGQSLGMGRPDRAKRTVYMGYVIGGGLMITLGILFVLFNKTWAGLFSDDPAVVDAGSKCLFITGFAQCGFAAAIIFGSALRGAGDTLAVMLNNLGSILGVRMVGAWFVWDETGLGA